MGVQDSKRESEAHGPPLSEGVATDEVVLSKDGFKLFPQPVVGDPLDPLNWTFARKHTILAVVMSL